jgi:hypothetical protein
MDNLFYQATIPVLIQGLKQMKHLVDIASTWCQEKNVPDQVMLSTRLSPDMFEWVRQIQIACDFAKGAAARLAGQEPPKFEDNEQTFAQVQERIQKTLSFIESIPASQYEEAEDRTIELTFGNNHFSYSGLIYWTRVVLPNFYFHFTTCYNVLRANGVPVGKVDFTGSLKKWLVPA